MSLNYRKEKAAKLSPSKRRMILIMFQRNIPYFPSLREIRDELIQAQINEITLDCKSWQDRMSFKQLKSMYSSNWERVFELGDFGNLEKPLTPEILQDPSHKITAHILYLYSMESFIYREINKASRQKDRSKIKFYGAYAAALSYIINTANKQRGRN